MTMYLPNTAVHPAESDPVEFLDIPPMYESKDETDEGGAVRPEAVLDALLAQQARVAGDILRIEDHTWAIHGVIPVDGDVIIAEFGDREEAQAVLDRLGPSTDEPWT